jgi:CubicO group peptidase (beta-lactamase class C family)
MASMTKPVTSVAIMMLVDEGRLKLDDDVAEYVPKWKDPLVSPSRAKRGKRGPPRVFCAVGWKRY